MKLKSYFLIAVISMFLYSCGGKKNVVKSGGKSTSKSKVTVVKTDESYKEIPSVNQVDHIKNLEKENPNLNSYTLTYIKKYAQIGRASCRERV